MSLDLCSPQLHQKKGYFIIIFILLSLKLFSHVRSSSTRKKRIVTKYQYHKRKNVAERKVVYTDEGPSQAVHIPHFSHQVAIDTAQVLVQLFHTFKKHQESNYASRKCSENKEITSFCAPRTLTQDKILPHLSSFHAMYSHLAVCCLHTHSPHRGPMR